MLPLLPSSSLLLLCLSSSLLLLSSLPSFPDIWLLRQMPMQDTNASQHNYDVNVVPPLGIWVDLQNGIEFMRSMEEQDGDGGKKKSKVITYFLKAQDQPKRGKKKFAALNKGAKIDADKDGGKDLTGVFLVENFIQEALDLYRKQQAQKIDYSRYLYVPVLSGWMARAASNEEGGEKNAASAIYKRYKLSEEKTFASFFHPDKQAIISLVNQFQEKKGKFSIPGYPQKLGFLLYGVSEHNVLPYPSH